MPTLHDLMASSIDGRAVALGAADASPAGATRGLIARRRRRNAAVAGGSSALAIGGLVAAGFAQDSRRDAPAATVDPTAVAYAEVRLDSPVLANFGFWNGFVGCGDPVPQSSGNLDGFAQTVTPSGPMSLGQDHVTGWAASSLTYSGADHTPVFVEPAYAVLAKDGVVVAQFSAYGTSSELEPLNQDESWQEDIALRDIYPCPADGVDDGSEDADALALGAGDYEVYVISQVHVTEGDIALEALRQQGYQLASPDYGNWAPGSIECEEELTRGVSTFPGAATLNCTPDALAGATIDTDKGVAVLPYRAGKYSGDVDATTVSDAIAFTVESDLTWRQAWSTANMFVTSTGPTILAPADLECGATFDGVEATSFHGNAPSNLVHDLLAGNEVEGTLDTSSDNPVVTVTMPSQGRAWIVTYGGGITSYAVVGQATATLEPSGPIAIDRWHGYATGSLQLSDITWCTGPATTVKSVIIVGEVTVKGDAGIETGAGLTYSFEDQFG